MSGLQGCNPYSGGEQEVQGGKSPWQGEGTGWIADGQSPVCGTGQSSELKPAQWDVAG